MKKIRLAAIFTASLFLFSVSAQAVNNPFAVSALNSAVLKAGTNSLNKRLGDLRRTKEEVNSALWIRGYYNDLPRYGGIDLDAAISGVEAGVDFRVLKDSPSRIYAGILAGYIGTENFQPVNNIKSGAPLIGIYETWLNPSGWFIDAAARYFFYSAQDVSSRQEKEFGMFAASIEGGKEFKIPANTSDFFIVEPKIKGVFGHIQSAALNSVKYGAAHTLIVRPAVFAGYSATLNNGAIVEPYVEGGYNQDFSSDMKISGYDSSSISGGSFDIGGGFNAVVTKIISIYTYAGYEKGDKIQNLSVNAGVRIALSGFKKDVKYSNTEEMETASSGTASAEPNTETPEIKSAEGASAGTAGETSAAKSVSGNNKTDDSKTALIVNNGSIASQDSSKESDADLEEGIAVNAKIEDAVSSHPVHFAFDKYEITPEEEEYLKAVAGKLKKSGKKYKINGYTDHTGNFEYNKVLSERRAKAVYDKLIEYGAPAEKLTYEGFSFTHPVNIDKTQEADTENRRVEITVLQ